MIKKILPVLILLLLILPLLPAPLGLGANNVARADPPPKVATNRQPDDAHTRSLLVRQNIDPEYVELVKDYGKRSDGKTPYGRTYKDTQSGQYIYEVQGLPMVDADGVRIVPEWELIGNTYQAKNNLFNLLAVNANDKFRLITRNDQPDGRKKNEILVFKPELWFGTVQQTRGPPTLLAVDSVNSNYTNNTLEWSYAGGQVIRRIRLIEGSMLGSWTFLSNPSTEVSIIYNQSGNSRLKLGQFATDNDTETIPLDIWNNIEYPFVVSDSATFYPDADPESTSVDGYVGRDLAFGFATLWTPLRNGAGTISGPSAVGQSNRAGIYYETGSLGGGDPNPSWTDIYRSIFLFDTSSLDDDSIISSATLSLYGFQKENNNTGLAPDINIYLSTPNTNITLIDSDYSQIGDVAQSSAISYAAFNTSGYNDFVLNDLTKIDVAGISKFGARNANMDVADVAPDYNNSNRAGLRVRYADYGSNKPKLVVVFTLPVAPTVTTQAASSVEDTTATGNGNITATGGVDPTTRGYEWDTDSGAPYSNNVTEGGSFGTGAFTGSLTSLPTGTTIYYRALAINSQGVGYGGEASFLTKPAKPTNVSATDGSETSKVVITWTKSTGATDYHVWRDAVDLGAAGDVATFDDIGAAAGIITPGTAFATDGSETGYITLSVSGESVANGTTYSYKVVASNASGDSDDSTPDNGYRGVGAITYQWQRSAADSDAGYGAIGGATTDPYNDVAAPAGSITNAGAANASDGTSGVHVTLSLAGEATTDGAGRYYYATLSATGTSNQDTTHNRGYRGVGAITYQWQRSAADSDAAYGNIGGATTDPYNDTGAPEFPDARWFRCVVSSVGASNSPQTSTADRGYRAIDFPVVTTQVATDVEDTTATGNGNITATGGENADWRGIVYDLASQGAPGDVPPAASGYADNQSSSGSFGTGAFTESLTGLPTGDIIYARAFAHNSTGWSYGGEINFLTKPAAPTNVSATDGSSTDNVTITWTKSTGATDYHVWRDAVDLGAAGDVATFDDSGADNGTITAGTASATDGTIEAYVTLSLSGEGTTVGTAHTYKVIASNGSGDSGDSNTDTGFKGIGSITFQWERSAADSDASFSPIGGATTNPYNDTGAPSNGDGRFFQNILSAAGTNNATSTPDRGFRGRKILVIYIDDVEKDATFLASGGVTDTSDNWIFLQNNVSPFTDNVSITIGGTLRLLFAPNSLILNDNLPDRSGNSHNGTINWGANPAGADVTMGTLVSISQPSPGEGISVTTTDILPDMTVSDWFAEPDVSGTLLTNPFRPFVLLMSDSTTLTELQAWRLLALALILLVTVATAAAVRSHMIITGIASGATIGGMVALTIFPLWAVVFAIGAIIGGAVSERTPSL